MQDQPNPGRPPRTWWKWLGLGAGVVVFLALIPVLMTLAGGQDDNSGDDPYDLPVKPADFIGYDIYGATTGAKQLPDGTGYLSGPDFDVGFGTLEISPYSELDFHAAAGHEFLRLTARNPGNGDSSTDDVNAQVVVDGKAHSVDLNKIEQSGLIVSVLKGHTAALRITDQGRTQSLDLRTGKLGPDAIKGYYPETVLTWPNSDYSGAGDTTVDGCRRATTLSLSFSSDDTAVLPWGPDVGWAQPGHAWLPISYLTIMRPVSVPDYDTIADMPPSCGIDREFDWDLAASVGVQTPQGEAAPVKVIPDSSGSGGTLVFDVPDTLTSGTLVVHPAISYEDGGAEHPANWTTAPSSARLPMAAK